MKDIGTSSSISWVKKLIFNIDWSEERRSIFLHGLFLVVMFNCFSGCFRHKMYTHQDDGWLSVSSKYLCQFMLKWNSALSLTDVLWEKSWTWRALLFILVAKKFLNSMIETVRHIQVELIIQRQTVWLIQQVGSVSCIVDDSSNGHTARLTR